MKTYKVKISYAHGPTTDILLKVIIHANNKKEAEKNAKSLIEETTKYKEWMMTWNIKETTWQDKQEIFETEIQNFI